MSPSTGTGEHGDKLIDYFRLRSVQDDLIVRTDDHAIIHHAQPPNGAILTRFERDGSLLLDPPGLTVTGVFPTGEGDMP